MEVAPGTVKETDGFENMLMFLSSDRNDHFSSDGRGFCFQLIKSNISTHAFFLHTLSLHLINLKQLLEIAVSCLSFDGSIRYRL